MMKSQVSLVTVKRDKFFETDDDTRDHCLETSSEEKMSVKTSYSQGQGEANKEAAENL